MNRILHKKIVLLGVTLFVCTGVGVFVVLLRTGHLPLFLPHNIIVEETLTIPQTVRVGSTDGRYVQVGATEAPLDPTRGKVISSQAIATLVGAYALALPEAQSWSSDAQLVFIKSLGVMTAEGKSGTWQIVFGSARLTRGYEIVVFASAVANKKEIVSAVAGYAVPKAWYDSPDALLSLRTQPQFKEATVSSLGLYYNEDGKHWGYAAATSRGTVSMPVQ